MSNKKENILITGITGFLGRNLIKVISGQYSDKYNIIGCSLNPGKVLSLQSKVRQHKNIKVECIDIVNDTFELEKLFVDNDIDYVIHSAAIKYMNFDDPVKLINTNVNGTLNVLKLANKYKVKNLIAISSDKANLPANTYGMTKALMESVVSHYGYSIYQGVNFLWSDGSVLDIWYDQIRKKNTDLTITNFDQERHYCHVTTVCIDLLTNLDQKNKILVPSKIFPIKLLDLYNNFIRLFADKNVKTIECGNRQDEKLHEDLLENIAYNIESDVDIFEKLKFSFDNEDINL